MDFNRLPKMVSCSSISALHFDAFNKMAFLTLLLTAFGLSGLTACTFNPQGATAPQERVVGERLQTIALPDRDTGEMSHLVLFDKTTHMIHQFDLNEMSYDRGLQVESPTAEHAVLFHADGNYVIDFTDKTISIYDSSGSRQRNPIHLPGQPISAAFRPRIGELAIYDSTGAIGLLKLDNEGHVTASAVFGSALAASSGNATGRADLTLVAADLTETGQLIVALSDNSISVFDFDQSVHSTGSQTWTPVRHFTTNMVNITWVAPLRSHSNLILVKDDNGLNLLNLSTQSVMSTYSGSNYFNLRVLSKSVDPHFVVSDDSGSAVRLGFVDPGSAADGSLATIQTRQLNLDPSAVTSSRLNLQTNSWMLTLQHNSVFAINGNTSPPSVSHSGLPAQAQSDSQDVLSYRMSDLLALGHHTYPLKATVKLLESQAFALYPSALGHATTCDISSGTERNLDFFNVGR